MKSGSPGDSGKRTPANPIMNTGIRNSWNVGKRTTVLRMVSSSFAAKAFMKRCGHMETPMALTRMALE